MCGAQDAKPVYGSVRWADGMIKTDEYELRAHCNRCGYHEKVLPAKATLDALIEQEQGEWVEWDGPLYHYRAKRDGRLVQCRSALVADSQWGGAACDDEAAYRAGRETGDQDGYARGLAEGRKEAEALRDAVLMRANRYGTPDFYLLWDDLVALARSMK